MADAVFRSQPVARAVRLETRGGNFRVVHRLVPPISERLVGIRHPVSLRGRFDFQIQPGQSAVEEHVDGRGEFDELQPVKPGAELHGELLF